ncbi:hypothetical protein, partial [Enterococcus faecium]|uniref:hypothetical protein n=1 Tax=Enterococcus faecium TaxID=1352 RepID=UPI003F51B6F9
MAKRSGSAGHAGAATDGATPAGGAAAVVDSVGKVSETAAFDLASEDIAKDPNAQDSRYFSLAYLQTSGLSAAQ